MSDRLHSSTVIPSDEVSPDSILGALQDVVVQLEDSLFRRADQRLPIAADWNTFRVEAASILEANDTHGRPGDLRFQASVGIL